MGSCLLLDFVRKLMHFRIVGILASWAWVHQKKPQVQRPTAKCITTARNKSQDPVYASPSQKCDKSQKSCR